MRTPTIDAAFVDTLIATIKADLTANLDGGIKVVYKAPECAVDVNVAVKAQADRARSVPTATVTADPGKVEVECKGGCSGGCSGSCSGELSCAVKAPSIQCEGSCEGSCTVEAGAQCSGTCNGGCDGECSARNEMGECHGECKGMCTGACELTAAAKCDGTCSGTCLVDQGSASCSAEAECRGSCDAKCEGSCKGEATPPSASADCDASADCQASASAQASAKIECTPPSLDLEFAFKAGLDANAQGAFVARIGELKVRGAAILQGAAKLTALIDGKIDGEVVFDPVSPIKQLTASIGGIISGGLSGKLFANLPKGRIPCVIPALKEAVSALGKAGTRPASPPSPPRRSSPPSSPPAADRLHVGVNHHGRPLGRPFALVARSFAPLVAGVSPRQTSAPRQSPLVAAFQVALLS
jgi:modification target Cys-rich repeat protein